MVSLRISGLMEEDMGLQEAVTQDGHHPTALGECRIKKIGGPGKRPSGDRGRKPTCTKGSRHADSQGHRWGWSRGQGSPEGSSNVLIFCRLCLLHGERRLGGFMGYAK